MIYLFLILCVVLAFTAYSFFTLLFKEIQVGTSIRLMCKDLANHYLEVQRLLPHDNTIDYLNIVFDSIDSLSVYQARQAHNMYKHYNISETSNFDYEKYFSHIEEKLSALEQFIGTKPHHLTARYMGINTQKLMKG